MLAAIAFHEKHGPMKTIDKTWVLKNIPLFAGQKCVVVTGAGISCTSGIPDYRSKNGLFKTPGKELRGKDHFDHRFASQKETRPIYLEFISRFKELCDNASPSTSHGTLNYLKSVSKLRVYSQNICGLEERAGLVANRTQRTELVLLHGDLKTLKCSYCGYRTSFTKAEIRKFKNMADVPCEKCLGRKGRASIPRGIMHPTIIHYNQPHPDSYFIGDLSEADKDLTALVVVGTSLKVYGVKRLVKHFLRNVNGASLFVNLEEPTKEFRSMFGYMWKGDCNEFFKVLREGLELMKISSSLRKVSIEVAEDKGRKGSERRPRSSSTGSDKDHQILKSDAKTEPFHADENRSKTQESGQDTSTQDSTRDKSLRAPDSHHKNPSVQSQKSCFQLAIKSELGVSRYKEEQVSKKGQEVFEVNGNKEPLKRGVGSRSLYSKNLLGSRAPVIDYIKQKATTPSSKRKVVRAASLLHQNKENICKPDAPFCSSVSAVRNGRACNTMKNFESIEGSVKSTGTEENENEGSVPGGNIGKSLLPAPSKKSGRKAAFEAGGGRKVKTSLSPSIKDYINVNPNKN